jgi:hypothetical protein
MNVRSRLQGAIRHPKKRTDRNIVNYPVLVVAVNDGGSILIIITSTPPVLHWQSTGWCYSARPRAILDGCDSRQSKEEKWWRCC